MNRAISSTNITLAFTIAISLIAAIVISVLVPVKSFLIAMIILIAVVSFISNEVALILVIFSMLLSPEITLGTLGPQTESARSITIRAEDILLILLGLIWFTKTAIHKELGLIAKTPLNKPIFIYIGVCFISTLLGVFAGDVKFLTGVFYILKYFEYFVLYFIVVNNIDEPKHINHIIHAVFITCAVICIYGIYQIPGGKRVSAPFEGETGEPNTLGGYLLIMFFLSAGVFLFSRYRRERLLAAGLLLIIVFPFLFTLSRTSYLAFIPAAIVFIVAIRKRVIVLIAVLLVIIVTPYFLPTPVTERLEYTFHQKPEHGQYKIGNIKLDTSTSERLKTWIESTDDFLKHPLLGYGITGYKFRDAQYVRALLETGLIGLAAFFNLLFNLFRESIRIYRNLPSNSYKGLTLGYIAGLTALTVHSIGANTFIIIRIMEPFWLVTGLIISLGHIKTENKLPEDTRIM